jgi:hypothetical protein
MITGRAVFARDTISDTIVAVLDREPDWSALPATTAPAIIRLLQRCLDKDPKRRLRDIGEARVDLDESRSTTSVESSAQTARGAWRHRRRIALVLVSAIALAAVGLGVLLIERRSPGARAAEWEPITDYADSVSSPALSPDGRMLAFLRGPRTFTTTGDVYVMMLPKGPTLQLTHNERQEKMDPVFNADSSSIAYTVPFETWTVPVTGGQPQLWAPNVASLRWIDTNSVLFSDNTGHKQMRVATSDASRTRQRTVYVPDGETGMAHRSYLSPDRNWVLVAAEMVRRPPWVWLPCRLVPFADSAASRTIIGPQEAACTAAALDAGIVGIRASRYPLDSKLQTATTKSEGRWSPPLTVARPA